MNTEYPPPKAGEPPLHRAARLGDHAAIERLVADGADVNAWFDLALDPGGRDFQATPLMVAAGSGYGATVETMRLLVRLGADSRRANAAGSIAFFAAHGLGWNYPAGGDAERLRFALAAGCDPNEKDTRDVAILAAAASTGDVARVRALLEAGAAPNPPWDRAAAVARTEELRAQFGADESMMPTPSAPAYYQIPLFCAVIAGALDCVATLLDAGARVDTIDESHRNALFHSSSAEVTRLLVARGADIEARDTYEWTPLMNACGESIDHVRALLAAGADPNATNDRGFTVFMHAAASMSRDVAVLRELVRAGANPLAVSELGYNALHAAIDVSGEANAEASVRSILGYLVELGVPLDARNKSGETPLDRARHAGTKIEVQVLEALMKPRS